MFLYICPVILKEVMSQKQTYLWERIKQVNQEVSACKDALSKWEKRLLLKVLIKQFQEEMGQARYEKFIASHKKELLLV
jgi:hypothetical protein